MSEYDETFEEDGGEAPLDTGDAGPTAETFEGRMALLAQLADGEGQLADLARETLAASKERAEKDALIAAQLAAAAETTPRTIAQIEAEYARVVGLGLEASEVELTAAVQARDDLHASLRAEVEARLAGELQAQIDGLYKFHIDAGDGEERAQNEVDLFLADYQAMLAIDLETGGDLIDQNDRWNGYLEESGNLKREAAVIEQMGLDDLGYDAAVVEAAEAELQGIMARRMGAVVGGVSE